jgi:hypothetical protein
MILNVPHRKAQISAKLKLAQSLLFIVGNQYLLFGMTKQGVGYSVIRADKFENIQSIYV